jgi:hypothetical protein
MSQNSLTNKEAAYRMDDRCSIPSRDRDLPYVTYFSTKLRLMLRVAVCLFILPCTRVYPNVSGLSR